MLNPETLGARIKKWRLIRGLTQSQLAEKLGMTEANLSSYERDKSDPPLKVLEKIAEILKVKTSYLLNGDIEDESDSLHPKAKKIVDSLARADGLSDADYDMIANQVETLIAYAKKNKKDS